MKIKFLILFLSLLFCSIVSAEIKALGNFKNPEAVKEVLSGQRKIANAAWWGFDKNDSTDALQEAINSGANKVIVPYMGSDWIVKPIKLQSNQGIVFDPGVVVVAKRGQFKSTGNSLFKAKGQDNIILRGYGATLKMQKKDYTGPDYEHGQWRMILVLETCTNIKVLGMTLKDSGGDGIYFAGGSGTGKSCKDILVEDCFFDNNLRQGISIISGENVRINNCIFKNTSGAQPGAGIDLEPNADYNKLVNIIVTNCRSLDNEGPGYVLGLHHLNSKSEPVSVLFYNCYVSECKWGLQVLSNDSDGPTGVIEFRQCVTENTFGPGVWVASKSRNFNLIFKECKFQNVCTGKIDDYEPYNIPVLLRISRQKLIDKQTFIEIDNCHIYDNKNRVGINIRPYDWSSGNINVKGVLNIENSVAKILSLGVGSNNAGLKIKHIKNNNQRH